MLFSSLALPDIEVETRAGGRGAPPQAVVALKGLALFDRKTRSTQYRQADSGYVSAWYLDEDYDRDCFVDCQMFFDFRRSRRGGRSASTWSRTSSSSRSGPSRFRSATTGGLQ